MGNKPNPNLIVGIDIGGSHISAALVDADNCIIQEGSFLRKHINSKGTVSEIIKNWCEVITAFINKGKLNTEYKIALAMPGPFDYTNGISLIKDLHKYENLYGINVKQALSEKLNVSPDKIQFRNDAEAFLAGEIRANGYPTDSRTLGITLGTGLGSAISQHSITKDANFAMLTFLDSIAEEFLSTRWFTSRFVSITKMPVTNVKDILSQVGYEEEIGQIFEEFTQNFTHFLCKIMEQENYQTLIIGGNISKAANRFLDRLCLLLHQKNSKPTIYLANLGEASAIIGASLLFSQSEIIYQN